jgi:hypothetical protein
MVLVDGLASSPADVAVHAERASAAGRVAVVCVFSEGCYACRSLSPKLRQIAELNSADATFIKVNCTPTDEEERQQEEGAMAAWARSSLGVDRLPWFLVYGPGDWAAGRPRASFTASLRPEKLALLRREIERGVAGLHGAPAAAAR